MKALILDGSPAHDELSQVAQRCLREELTRRGWETSAVVLREKPDRPCVGCLRCWLETPGLCAIPDDAPEISRAMIQSQLVVFLTPVTFGGYSSHLKKILDRSICLISPFFTNIGGEVHHEARYREYFRLLAIGTAGRQNAETAAIFAQLVARNALNLHLPGHAALVLHNAAGAQSIADKLTDLFPIAEAAR